MTLISDIADYLEDNSLGTVGVDIFYSHLPDAGNSCIAVYDTGGPQPEADIPTKSPTFQVFIRSTDYNTGRGILDSVRSLLHRQSGATIGSTYFFFILAQSEGGHLGRNERGLEEFSINFISRTT